MATRLLWTFQGLYFLFLRGGFPDAGRQQALLLLFRRGAKLVQCLDSLAKIVH